MKKRRLYVLFSVLLAIALVVGVTGSALAFPNKIIKVQILALNDFHGALDPSKGIGGAEYLATYVKNLEALNENTVKVSAGDMIGASPLLSALFHDEPTIQAFNLMGFDFSAAGNHEFDEGWTELLRMQYGGCSPIDGCYEGVPAFTGATFDYLTANVIRLDDEETLFPPYMIREYGNIKVAFIGISLESTPTIVVPSGVAGLEFLPEVRTINHTVQYLKDNEGIKAFVILLHDGAGPAPDPNGCNPTDPFFTNIIKNINPEVDVVITGHSHNAYKCSIEVKKNYHPMLVTSAGSSGKFLTDINMDIYNTNGQVAAVTGQNISIVDANVTLDTDMKALLDQYRAISVPIANQVVGEITADLTRTQDTAGESALGDVIGDAQLLATSDVDAGSAVVAMTNPGGIRTDLFYTQSVGEGDGNVTYGEAFAVQPFSNSLVTMTLTGAQLKAVLEQQFQVSRMLQISDSLHYSWSASAPLGSKIVSMQIDSVDVDPAASYRITINNFLAGGGDGFTTFLAGTDLLTGMIDLDAFVNYLQAASPISPPALDRITKLP